MLSKILRVFSIFAIMYVWWTGKIIHQQPDRDALIAAIWHHVGFGILILVPLLLVWVVSWRAKKNTAYRPARRISASGNLFWGTVGSLILTGVLTVWARGSSLKLFDWMAIPSPVERMQSEYEFLESTHGILGYILVVVMVVYMIIFLATTGWSKSTTSNLEQR